MGIYIIFMAAEQASKCIIEDYKEDFKTLTKRTYKILDLAGFAFGSSLVLLVIIAGLKLLPH
jgi:hypothetical protein